MVDVAAFKTRLEARKAELQERLDELEHVLDDPKSADFSERATESEFDEVYESQGLAGLEEIHAIDAALNRIENDVFGVCLSCGEEISDERLDAVPFATKCRKCMK